MAETLGAQAAHALARLLVGEQLGDRSRQLDRRVDADVARRVAGRCSSLAQVEHHLRLAERHVLEHLVHRAVVVVLVDRIARDTEVHGAERGEQEVVGDAPRQIDEVAQAEASRRSTRRECSGPVPINRNWRSRRPSSPIRWAAASSR